jgi:hypothetical protein
MDYNINNKIFFLDNNLKKDYIKLDFHHIDLDKR